MMPSTSSVSLSGTRREAVQKYPREATSRCNDESCDSTSGVDGCEAGHVCRRVQLSFSL